MLEGVDFRLLITEKKSRAFSNWMAEAGADDARARNARLTGPVARGRSVSRCAITRGGAGRTVSLFSRRDEAHETAGLGYAAEREWDPFGSIEYCESAGKRPQSEEATLAMRVQLIEWQLLFDHCARGRDR